MTRPIEPCTLCRKPPREGCSHTACPCRRVVTAQLRGTPAAVGESTGVRAYEPNRFENLK